MAYPLIALRAHAEPTAALSFKMPRSSTPERIWRIMMMLRVWYGEEDLEYTGVAKACSVSQERLAAMQHGKVW